MFKFLVLQYHIVVYKIYTPEMHNQIIFKDLKLGICWHTPLYATFRSQRQAHLSECKASLVYIYSSRLIQGYKVVA